MSLFTGAFSQFPAYLGVEINGGSQIQKMSSPINVTPIEQSAFSWSANLSFDLNDRITYRTGFGTQVLRFRYKERLFSNELGESDFVISHLDNFKTHLVPNSFIYQLSNKGGINKYIELGTNINISKKVYQPTSFKTSISGVLGFGVTKMISDSQNKLTVGVKYFHDFQENYQHQELLNNQRFIASGLQLSIKLDFRINPNIDIKSFVPCYLTN